MARNHRRKSMYNLGTVVRFEITRTVKKKSFWLISLMFPVIVGVLGGVIYFSNKATDTASQQAASEHFSLAVTDQSRLITPAVLKEYKAKTFSHKSQGIQAVKSGKIDAYFYYPPNVATQKVEVYGKDVGLFDNSRYSSVASSLLQSSVQHKVTPSLASVLAGTVNVDSTTYKDGAKYNGINQMIVPGVFLVLFYILIVTFGNQMLSSTTEEKENRVIEMILTAIEARTLVVGKIFSLIILGLFQMSVILIPIIIGYLLFHNRLDLPSVDLAHLTFNWPRIIISFLVFAMSFITFTGLLVAIGAATPTAKEAGPFFGIVMLFVFGPLYAAPLFISSPDSGIVQVLSFFPLTAPIPLMLRNAVGNLSFVEAGIAIVILFLTAVFLISIAVRTFKFGALEYSRKLSIKEILTRRA